MKVPKKVMTKVLRIQKIEITEYHVYSYFSKRLRCENGLSVLCKISKDELWHYNYWKKISGVDIAPNKFKVFWYCALARIFGLTFGLRLMESNEDLSAGDYKELAKHFDGVEKMIEDEDSHKKQLMGLLDDSHLDRMGSVVLGLNDALVELTGALAGFTFAFSEIRQIAVAGVVTGFAASLSMAASEFLSKGIEKSEDEESGSEALLSSLFTGVAYIVTVVFLVAPYFILEDKMNALATTLGVGVCIIIGFNYYLSVVRGFPFLKRCIPMILISFGVALVSFGVGHLLNSYM